MSFRKYLFIAVFGIFLAGPLHAFARPLTGIVNASLPAVSMANFLTWTLQALDFPREPADCTLQFNRIPRGMRQTLCTAQAYDVLAIFGKSRNYSEFNKTITHGEALMVITTLLDKHEKTPVDAFKDVKSDGEKAAVMNAVALKWMVPVRANFFGVDRPLTGSEAMALLKAVSGQTAARYRETISVTVPVNSSVLPKQDLINAVWQLITRDFLKSDKISQEEAAYKAIEGLVDSLDDPYTNFFRPVSASDFSNQIKGEISGIGAQIEERKGEIVIVSPLPGSPAERAGLGAGDVILEANGISLTGMGAEKAVTYIRGERGSQVTLKIRRNGSEISVTCVRDVISIPEIQVKWHGDTAVVQLVQFGETTEKQIRTIFSDINQKHPRGIILDLRNNGGGLLSAADLVVSNFVPRGTVVAKVESRSETTEERTDGDPTVDPATKVVVLVNKASASASEIVAGALQDLDRATIVGTQTFGKGTVQEVIGFRTGEALKITIAEWLTPNGRKLEGIGVKPDVIIDTTDRDEQLQRALNILR
ncbi:hypothetical protein A3J34_03805 [Candidatus Peribacteria bacterium RIFCSPLOWO2_02_FULL_51_10]|nr:MAG: hypothetical protein A3C52_01665 [Candidatus Peribacteria bacterium RIFCSPHIGHO2_02_FULL_51_15]OGJ68150.1 MAG: hypothetical protein A3J34_03805 [Candidatus Peribacteria bacterium RIFCSPLOWO2_02_FULL_51_10]